MKIANSMMGNKNHFYGKTHSEQAKKQMSEAKIGTICSEENKVKLSKLYSGKTWELINGKRV